MSLACGGPAHVPSSKPQAQAQFRLYGLFCICTYRTTSKYRHLCSYLPSVLGIRVGRLWVPSHLTNLSNAHTTPTAAERKEHEINQPPANQRAHDCLFQAMSGESAN